MKPDFALSLSFDGISLLKRAAGGWRSVGEVSPDAPDLAQALADLRARGEALGAEPMRCKVILPNDQIRYLTIETGPFSGDARLGMVCNALDGATPYAVDDLAFDISADGNETHVAAVARETLAEAEAFAVDNGFNPVSFVAVPADNPFLGEPFFGATAHAATLNDVDTVEPDGIAVVVIGSVDDVDPDRAAPAEPPDQAPPASAFSSRRNTRPVSPTETEPGGSQPDRIEQADDPGERDKPSLSGEAAAAGGNPAPAPGTPKPGFRSRRSKPLRIEPGDTPSETDNPPEPAQPDPTEPGPVTVVSPALEFEPDPEPVLRSPAPEPVPVAQDEPPAPLRVHDGFSGSEVVTTEEEATRLTVFGARDRAAVGGKPRHLGLILTAALLIFLAAVAVWATLFLEDGIAGLFRGEPESAPVVAVAGTPAIGDSAQAPSGDLGGDSLPTWPAPSTLVDADRQAKQADEPDAPTTPDVLASLPEDIQPPEPAAEVPSPGVEGEPAPGPELTDTDAAVLDALGQLSDPAGAAEPERPEVASRTPPADPAQEAARYAATGIWQDPPAVPTTPSIIGLDDLYVASIDRTDLSQDAVALPALPEANPDTLPATVSLPAAAGTSFDLDETGLVEATPNGTLNPDGILVYLGRPAVVPPPSPDRPEQAPAETETPAPDLSSARPKARPSDLAENFERGQLGGLTRDELAQLRPRSRPLTDKQKAELDETPTAQAVVVSRQPLARPRGFATVVQKARRASPPPATTPPEPTQTAAAPNSASRSSRPSGDQEASRGSQVASVAPRTVTPKIPSSASVARQATLNNAINLRQINLIGVYGSPSNRRALVRLPSGRYKKVKVGDSVDGGRVVAIGDSELRYQKGGRNLTLKIPRG